MSGPVEVLVEMDWDCVFKISKAFKVVATLQKTLETEVCFVHVRVFRNTRTWRQILEPRAHAYWAMSSYQSTKTNGIWLVIWTDFVILGLLELKIKVGHDIPESWPQTFYRHMLSSVTQIGIGFFPVRTIFAQCSSSSSLTSEKWELITWNLGQIFGIELWMVGQ